MGAAIRLPWATGAAARALLPGACKMRPAVGWRITEGYGGMGLGIWEGGMGMGLVEHEAQNL